MYFLSVIIMAICYFQIISSHVRKFNQLDFDKWIDEKDFLIVLFCQSKTDKSCSRELEKMKQLSMNLGKYKEILVGYLDRKDDSILFSRYQVDTTPLLVLFPFGHSPIFYKETLRFPDIENYILDIFQSNKNKKSVVKQHESKHISHTEEIDALDFLSTVKDPNHHSMLMLYESDCKSKCAVFEKVASVFKQDSEVKFFKMNIENAGNLLNTFRFNENPSLFWYPIDEKDSGFLYGGEISLPVLVEFVNDEVGLSRDTYGELKINAGRIPEIDRIINENMMSILLKINLANIIEKLEEKSKQLHHLKKYSDYYLSIVKEISKSDMETDKVLDREQKFMMKQLTKKNISSKQTENWRQLLNIISGIIEMATQKLTQNQAELYAMKALEESDPYVSRQEVHHRFSHHDEL